MMFMCKSPFGRKFCLASPPALAVTGRTHLMRGYFDWVRDARPSQSVPEVKPRRDASMTYSPAAVRLVPPWHIRGGVRVSVSSPRGGWHDTATGSCRMFPCFPLHRGYYSTFCRVCKGGDIVWFHAGRTRKYLHCTRKKLQFLRDVIDRAGNVCYNSLYSPSKRTTPIGTCRWAYDIWRTV